MESRDRAAQDLTPQQLTDVAWTLRRFAMCVVFVAGCLLQDPGRLVADTKLDLVVDPARFLGRSLHMWDPSGFAGQVQNQAYGYLFPMGPFFVLCDAIGMPGWVAQRLWWALILSIAFLGAEKLAARLGIGTPLSRFAGALAYALAPRVLSVLGAVSAEALPTALAPWVLVPLVGASAGGSWRRRAALSAVAVALMGGVNAALTLAAIMPAVLWFATRRWTRDCARLAAWWSLGVMLATLWWVIPLLLLGRYSPPFLDYIESASTTTFPTNLAETIRGTSDWVAYLPTGFGSVWQIGPDLVRTSTLVLDTVIVAAAGLIGLSTRTMRERTWLLCCLGLGIALVTFGHVGAIDGWFAHPSRDLLDGALSPLRNVHKFDPLIRLPIALGVMHLLGRVDWQTRLEDRRLASVVLAGVVAVMVVMVASPALTGRLAPASSFAEVPGYWKQTGTWLRDNPNGRALLAPGSRFGRYLWGVTNDEPIQATTTAEWEVRNAIPLVPGGHIRMLDAVERRLQIGEPSSGLSTYLTRNGIGYLVVRHDLDDVATQAARPAMVHQTLNASPGFTLVKTFGPRLEAPDLGTTTIDGGRRVGAAAVEIWKVGSSDLPRATLSPADDVGQLSGGPESILDLADSDAMPPAPTILTAQTDGYRPTGPFLLSDTYRRRETNFGRSLDNESATMSPGDPSTLGRRVRDYLPLADRHLAVGEWVGARSVRASSALADADVFGATVPADGVAAAFDGDLKTVWTSDPAHAGTPQSISIDFGRRRLLGQVTVSLPAGLDSQITAVGARVGGTTVPARADPKNPERFGLDLAGLTASSVRITVTPSTDSAVPVAVADVAIDGIPIRHRIRMPADGGDRVPDVISMRAAVGADDGCVTLRSGTVSCLASATRPGEDATGLDRSFSLPARTSYGPDLTVTARPGLALSTLISKQRGELLHAISSSDSVDTPLSDATAAIDGDEQTAWAAGGDDESPTLTLGWNEPHTVTSLMLQTRDDSPVTRPSRLTVQIGKNRIVREVGRSGRVNLPRTRTKSISLTLAADGRTASVDTESGATGFLPLGVGEVSVRGGPRNDPAFAQVVDLPCGSGPELRVDGRAVRTRVTATVDELRHGAPVRARRCGATDALDLAAGRHTLAADQTPLWRVTSLVLTRAESSVDGAPRAAKVTRWDRTQRTIDVGSRTTDEVLTIPENTNAGWTASLGGHRLRPVVVDGWKQGFRVPNGRAGSIDLRYGPDTSYRAGLLVGLATLLGLIVMAAVRPRTVNRLEAIAPATVQPFVHAAFVALVLGLVAGTPGFLVGIVILGVAYGTSSRRPLAERRPAWTWSLVVALALGSAGTYLALRPWGESGYAGRSAVTQLLCVVALAACAIPPTWLPVSVGTGEAGAPRTGTGATPPERSAQQ